MQAIRGISRPKPAPAAPVPPKPKPAPVVDRWKYTKTIDKKPLEAAAKAGEEAKKKFGVY